MILYRSRPIITKEAGALLVLCIHGCPEPFLMPATFRHLVGLGRERGKRNIVINFFATVFIWACF